MYAGICIIYISSLGSTVDRWKWKTLKTRQCIPTMFLRWLALKSNQIFCYIIGSCTLHFDVCSHDSDQSLRSILIKFSTHVFWHKISVKWAKLLKPFQIGGNFVVLKERYVLRAYYKNQSHLTKSSKKLHKSNDFSLVCIHNYDREMVGIVHFFIRIKSYSVKLFKIITGPTETQFFSNWSDLCLEKHFRRNITCCLEEFYLVMTLKSRVALRFTTVSIFARNLRTLHKFRPLLTSYRVLQTIVWIRLINLI